MSAALLGLAFGAEAPSATAKLILLKLVDCCRDDGRAIYPAVPTVARAAQCSDRTVQATLKLFCAVGLLRRVREGGRGRGSTACYELSLDTLRRMASDGWAAIAGPMTEAESDAGEAQNKGEIISPLAEDRVKPAPVKGEARIHPTPQTEPLTPEREGVRGREIEPEPRPDGEEPPEEPPTGTPTLDDFRKAWPTSAADNLARVEAEWSRLPFDERGRATAAIPAFLAELKTLRRDRIPAGFTYLHDRSWNFLGEATKAKAAALPVMVDAFSRLWWAVLLARIEAGRDCRFMVSRACESRGGVSVLPHEVPSLGERERLKGHPSDGQVAARWTAWLAARGLRLPTWTKTTWLYLPGDWPPGMTSDDGGDL